MAQHNKPEVMERLRELARKDPDQKLPSMRSLASAWNVGLQKVQIAIHRGVQQEWLCTRPGSGVWARKSLPDPTPPVRRMDALRLADAIGAQIQSGKFAFDEALPSPKDHAKHHGVHPATARKALGVLLSKGLVERRGRSWIVNRPVGKKSTRTPVLWCIGASEEPGRIRIDSDREWDFWRDLQSEAIRSGLAPRLVTWDGELPEPDESVFGAVVSTWHLPENMVVLDALQRAKIPTAVWVATEDVLPGKRYRQARGMWFHDLAHGRSAGETMGRFLSGQGHRKIAWICPFQGSSWAKNRMAGLWAELGPQFETFEAIGPWISEWDIQVQVAEDPAVVGRIDLSGIADQGPYDSLRRPLAEWITRERTLSMFTPQLEAALDSGATLWVAASDLVAQWCLHWLAARGLRPPRDLALASFDDTRDSSRQNLTSLRFDVQGMIRSMVRQILSSRDAHPLVSRYAGHVVERGTTALHPRAEA
ncbi:MAG: substrate-binding domain-containing protein [Fibrobacteres bacterium]|jgi:DNA-binding transcriptional regulator YhcF (GntR family)|nr:substrate-binding domain-containing protein [Fibrobacterota bacterium]